MMGEAAKFVGELQQALEEEYRFAPRPEETRKEWSERLLRANTKLVQQLFEIAEYSSDLEMKLEQKASQLEMANLRRIEAETSLEQSVADHERVLSKKDRAMNRLQEAVNVARHSLFSTNESAVGSLYRIQQGRLLDREAGRPPGPNDAELDLVMELHESKDSLNQYLVMRDRERDAELRKYVELADVHSMCRVNADTEACAHRKFMEELEFVCRGVCDQLHGLIHGGTLDAEVAKRERVFELRCEFLGSHWLGKLRCQLLEMQGYLATLRGEGKLELQTLAHMVKDVELRFGEAKRNADSDLGSLQQYISKLQLESKFLQDMRKEFDDVQNDVNTWNVSFVKLQQKQFSSDKLLQDSEEELRSSRKVIDDFEAELGSLEQAIFERDLGIAVSKLYYERGEQLENLRREVEGYKKQIRVKETIENRTGEHLQAT